MTTEADLKRRGILAELFAERVRQDAKWGAGRDYPDGTNPAWRRMADAARCDCDEAAESGELDWLHIAKEEIFESFAETGPEKLRAELVQAAASIVAWIEGIDSRDGGA